MTIEQYIESINKRYKLGNATEHTFRGDLQQLIETLVPEIRATNEPKRQSYGTPDYLSFHLYHDGEFITKITIAEIHNGSIKPIQENSLATSPKINGACH